MFLHEVDTHSTRCKAEVQIDQQSTAAVTHQGNADFRKLISTVFETADVNWCAGADAPRENSRISAYEFSEPEKPASGR